MLFQSIRRNMFKLFDQFLLNKKMFINECSNIAKPVAKHSIFHKEILDQEILKHRQTRRKIRLKKKENPSKHLTNERKIPWKPWIYKQTLFKPCPSQTTTDGKWSIRGIGRYFDRFWNGKKRAGGVFIVVTIVVPRPCTPL